MIGGSLRVLWLLPPLKLVAMIYNGDIAESGVKHQISNQIKSYFAILTFKSCPLYIGICRYQTPALTSQIYFIELSNRASFHKVKVNTTLQYT
jgi:hypothetical protein